MLEMLAKTKDFRNVSPFVSRCFESVDALGFGDNNIVSIIAHEREEVQLLKPVIPGDSENKGALERWMKDLEVKIKRTMKEISNECIKNYPLNHDDFLEYINKYPTMSVGCSSKFKFTQDTEKAFNSLLTLKNSMEL